MLQDPRASNTLLEATSLPLPDGEQLERDIRHFGAEIFDAVSEKEPSRFEADYYTDLLMQWSMKDPDFKVSLFRFVGVFPDLVSSEAIIRHAQEYFGPVSHHLPAVLRAGLSVSPKSMAAKVAAQVIKKQIRAVAKRFIVGETPQAALAGLRKLRGSGLAFTIDLLGEAVVSELESEQYLARYHELLNTLHEELPGWSESDALIEGHRGEQTPVNISVKLSALYSQTKPLSTDSSVEILSERLSVILRQAKEIGAFVYLDMEDCASTSIIIETFKRTLSLPEFRSYDRCGLVLQAYLRRTETDVEELLQWVRERGTPVGIRLVKGAYWDTETILAKQHGWPYPVWQDKSASDACFERITLTLLQHPTLIYPAFGSHNIRSLCFAVQAAEHLGIDTNQFELQMLYGMAEPIKAAFTERGYLVRDYAPIGEMIPGMGYLVRRLLENTSNEGFLRLRFHENEKAETLLRKPTPSDEDTADRDCHFNHRREFNNEPLIDFTFQEAREDYQREINRQQQAFQNHTVSVKPIVSGSERMAEESVTTSCPDDTAMLLAEVSLASESLAEDALKDMADFFPQWRSTTVEERATILFTAADIMHERRVELAATLTLEVSKQWTEADADVAEAIDFLRYYALEAKNLFTPKKLGSYPGESNSYLYEPRGIALVIGPWNFPLAIPCGMFAAALVTGNCAVLKPAEQSSLIAKILFDIFLEAGLPERAACFLPARGETTGAYLVNHPLVSTIVFTGSKDVGLEIIRQAATTRPGQTHVKRVVAEMGGKNAIIVDDDADLDEAVRGVVYSAFGFQGQKCSACSRAIVVSEHTYQRFTSRLLEAVKSLVIGPASAPHSFVSSVIDETQFNRVQEIIARCRESANPLVEATTALENLPNGHYISPIVFSELEADHFLLSTEVFGPVLALQKADSFEQALEMSMDSEFGLTGAVYSRSPRHIAEAIEEFRVGNLYINRGSTGALVMRQPFGGARMSGVGSKAGGPDYLLQFVIPRAVSENTMRSGFAPELA